MNQTHIHLLITHLPIFGSILGALVLAYGLWKNSDSTKSAAYYLFIISSIGSAVAYITGEAAEETIENTQGVAEASIKQHQEFAIYALLSLILLGLASILGLFLTLKKSTLTRTTAFIILFISLICFVLIARTGYLGGKIRHTELGSATNINQILNEIEVKND